MPRCTRLLVALLTCALALLGGCTDTYRVTFEMAPNTSVAVRVLGAGPLTSVDNEGPGAVLATFDADHALAATISVAAGTASGRTLHGTKVVRLETDGAPAKVRVEARRAKGLAVDWAGPAE